VKIKNKKKFITGSTGFIGSRLAEKLLCDNEIIYIKESFFYKGLFK